MSTSGGARLRRVALAVAVAAGCMSCSAPASAAQFEASTMPTETVFPTTGEVTYRVSMLAGPSDEDLRIEQIAPSWRQQGVRAGAPAYHVQTSLEGAGQFMPGPIAISSQPGGPARGLVLSCGGTEPFAAQFPFRDTVHLPAGARATLVTTWRLSRQAPFSFTDYRPRLTVTSVGITQPIILPRPRLAGLSGVPVRLLANKSGRVGRIMRVQGNTDPALAGERISLRLIGPVSYKAQTVFATPGRFRTIARVRVDRLGRFEYRWRPRRGGLYGAYPAYLGQPPGIVRDRGCPSLLKIR